MTLKRSFTIVINLETDDASGLTDVDETEIVGKVQRALEDEPLVAYIAHGEDSDEWTEA